MAAFLQFVSSLLFTITYLDRVQAEDIWRYNFVTDELSEWYLDLSSHPDTGYIRFESNNDQCPDTSKNCVSVYKADLCKYHNTNGQWFDIKLIYDIKSNFDTGLLSRCQIWLILDQINNENDDGWEPIDSFKSQTVTIDRQTSLPTADYKNIVGVCLSAATGTGACYWNNVRLVGIRTTTALPTASTSQPTSESTTEHFSTSPSPTEHSNPDLSATTRSTNGSPQSTSESTHASTKPPTVTTTNATNNIINEKVVKKMDEDDNTKNILLIVVGCLLGICFIACIIDAVWSMNRVRKEQTMVQKMDVAQDPAVPNESSEVSQPGLAPLDQQEEEGAIATGFEMGEAHEISQNYNGNENIHVIRYNIDNLEDDPEVIGDDDANATNIGTTQN